jgi:hypothetical protein
VLAGEAEFIIAAHIRGLRALHWSVVPTALLAAVLPVVFADGPQVGPLWPIVPAWLTAWLMQRVFLAVAARYEPPDAALAATKDIGPLCAAAACGLAVWRMLSGVALHLRVEGSALVGGMIAAYLVGRVWDVHSQRVSTVIGAVVGLPLAFGALALGLLVPLRSDFVSQPTDLSHMLGAACSIVLGGLGFGVASQLSRRGNSSRGLAAAERRV